MSDDKYKVEQLTEMASQDKVQSVIEFLKDVNNQDSTEKHEIDEVKEKAIFTSGVSINNLQVAFNNSPETTSTEAQALDADDKQSMQEAHIEVNVVVESTNEEIDKTENKEKEEEVFPDEGSEQNFNENDELGEEDSLDSSSINENRRPCHKGKWRTIWVAYITGVCLMLFASFGFLIYCQTSGRHEKLPILNNTSLPGNDSKALFWNDTGITGTTTENITEILNGNMSFTTGKPPDT